MLVNVAGSIDHFTDHLDTTSADPHPASGWTRGDLIRGSEHQMGPGDNT